MSDTLTFKYFFVPDSRSLLGHGWLFKHANILHRDVSVGNMMIREREGKIYGVLNDFDLSEDLSETPKYALHDRTGTPAFMAWQLQMNKEPTRHLYRYDLESFFWVLVWLAHRYDWPAEEDVEGLEERYLNVLDKLTADGPGEWENIANYKCTLLSGSLRLLQCSEWGKTLEPCIWQLREMFKDQMDRQVAKGSDSETLGGHITYEELLAILIALRDELEVAEAVDTGEEDISA